MNAVSSTSTGSKPRVSRWSAERFTSEDSYHGRLAYFVEHQPDQVAYLIVDDEIFSYPERVAHKLVDGWETVEEMEKGLGLPGGSLTTTLAEYNRDAADGIDRRFRKQPEWLKPLRGPWAAFDISMSSSDYHYISLGGLSTNEHGQALDSAGRPVAGLYAVGACAAHLPQNGAEYASGMSLGPGSFCGAAPGAYGPGGSITVQPRRRRSAASWSAGMRPRSCSWAERRHPGTATGGPASGSASRSRSMNASASSRVNRPPAWR